MRAVRLRRIQETVLRDGYAEVDALASQLDLSKETIRRDLSALAAQGLVVRTRGGAAAPGMSLTEVDLKDRCTEHRSEKEAIAHFVNAILVQNGMSVALDAGTTAAEIAKVLRGRAITVVTPSLMAVNELAGSETDVLVVGGFLRHRSMGTVGSVAEDAAAQFMCDLAFISGPALNLTHGLMDSAIDTVSVKRAMLSQARRRYAVVDHSKVNRSAFTTVCKLDELTGIVVDSRTDPEMLQQCRDIGLEVHVAPTKEPAD